jgi:hypothetical protein
LKRYAEIDYEDEEEIEMDLGSACNSSSFDVMMY